MLTRDAAHGWYLAERQPPGALPGHWFVPLSCGLGLLVGAAAWLAWRHPGHRRALRLWGWNLLLSAAWAPAFFALHAPALALPLACGHAVAATVTADAFRGLDRSAALLMLPSLGWAAYSAYLSAGFWWLDAA